MKKIIITGFKSFNGDSINSSEKLIKQLSKMEFKGKEVKFIVLPVTRNSSFDILKKEIDLFKPDIVINVGQAGNRDMVTIERIAINIDDYRIPDNLGEMPIDESIIKTGEIAYWATLDVKAIIKHIVNKGLNIKISESAGTYVCNTLMYKTLYYSNIFGYKSTFIHIPKISGQISSREDKRFMHLEDIIKIFIEIINFI